jgi:hypothetical protein
MPGGRPARDHESVQRVLLLGGLLVGLVGLAVTAWGLATERWGLLVGPVLVVFAAVCVAVSRDDGRGQWCPECVARNPEGVDVCESCGHRLG